MMATAATRQTEARSADGRWFVALIDLETLGTAWWCVYDQRPETARAYRGPVWTLDEGDPYAEDEPGTLQAPEVLDRFLADLAERGGTPRGW